MNSVIRSYWPVILPVFTEAYENLNNHRKTNDVKVSFSSKYIDLCNCFGRIIGFVVLCFKCTVVESIFQYLQNYIFDKFDGDIFVFDSMSNGQKKNLYAVVVINAEDIGLSQYI